MAATTSTTQGRKNGIGGFYTGKIDEAIMLEYIKKNDLSDTLGGVDDEMSKEQIGVALATHLKSTVPTARQVKCDVCLGISDRDEAACPFCGDDGQVLDEEADAKDEKPFKLSGAQKVEKPTFDEVEKEDEAEEEEDEAEEEEDEIVEDEDLDKEARAEREAITEDEDEATPVAQAAPTGAKKTTKKGTKNMTATESVTNGVAKKNGKSTAIAKAEVGSLIGAKDLDKAVSKVIEIKSRGARDYWELGAELAEINKKQLWKMRVLDNGKNKYNGFDAFVIAELQMSPQGAYRAIEVATNYTKDEAYALGTTKASLILQAAPKDRKKLETKAKSGASKRELEKDVKESRAKNGAPKKSQQAKAGAKGGAKKAATTTAKSEKISMAAIEGLKTVKLHKKPANMRGVVFSELPRATKMADQPVGRQELGNGLVQYYVLIAKDDGWALKVETRRESAVSEE